MMPRRDIVIGLIVLALAGGLPFLGLSRYVVTQVTVLFIWATVVTQWNLVFGVAGIFSLAQMALFAVGGYATAMLGLYFEWSLWFALPVAGLAAVLFSLFVGLACLRLSGAYVALLTLAIAYMLFLLIVTDSECVWYEGATCRSLTEGWRGLGRYGDFGFRDWLGGQFILGNYFLALALLALATVFSIVIIHSPIGMAFRALRDNPAYAVARGISRFKYQVLVFACSAFFTGLAGSVYAGNFKVIGPNVLQLPLLLFLISMMIVGGVGTVWGPLVGAVLLMGADEILKEDAFADVRAMGLGILLAAFVVVMPRGVVGSIAAMHERRRNRRAAAAD
jgi:branched-chain amino acid transport system permease protein